MPAGRFSTCHQVLYLLVMEPVYAAPSVMSGRSKLAQVVSPSSTVTVTESSLTACAGTATSTGATTTAAPATTAATRRETRDRRSGAGCCGAVVMTSPRIEQLMSDHDSARM